MPNSGKKTSALEKAVTLRKRQQFGRISGIKVPQARAEEATDAVMLRSFVGRLTMVDIGLLEVADNVRSRMDHGSPEFQALVKSIQARAEVGGLIQNLVVDLREVRGQYRAVVVAGQRRFYAAKEAGLRSVPALITKLEGEDDGLVWGLDENLLRKDLSPLDLAEGYSSLLDHGWSVEAIATRYNRDPRTIERYLKLAALPQDVKAQIDSHPKVFTARVLLNEFAAREMGLAELRGAVAEKIAQKQAEFALGVGVSRKNASTAKIQSKAQATQKITVVRKSEFAKMTETALRSVLPVRASVSGEADKGIIRLRYQSQEEYCQLMQLLGIITE